MLYPKGLTIVSLIFFFWNFSYVPFNHSMFFPHRISHLVVQEQLVHLKNYITLLVIWKLLFNVKYCLPILICCSQTQDNLHWSWWGNTHVREETEPVVFNIFNFICFWIALLSGWHCYWKLIKRITTMNAFTPKLSQGRDEYNTQQEEKWLTEILSALWKKEEKSHQWGQSRWMSSKCQVTNIHLSDLPISDSMQLNFKSYSQFCLHLSILYHPYATDGKKETQSCRSDTISFLSLATELLQPSLFLSRFHNGHDSQVLKKHGCHPSWLFTQCWS